jgi:hypothetical protein
VAVPANGLTNKKTGKTLQAFTFRLENNWPETSYITYLTDQIGFLSCVSPWSWDMDGWSGEGSEWRIEIGEDSRSCEKDVRLTQVEAKNILTGSRRGNSCDSSISGSNSGTRNSKKNKQTGTRKKKKK